MAASPARVTLGSAWSQAPLQNVKVSNKRHGYLQHSVTPSGMGLLMLCVVICERASRSQAATQQDKMQIPGQSRVCAHPASFGNAYNNTLPPWLASPLCADIPVCPDYPCAPDSVSVECAEISGGATNDTSGRTCNCKPGYDNYVEGIGCSGETCCDVCGRPFSRGCVSAAAPAASLCRTSSAGS